jgi:tetratricopeptide (TPR) repeat protein
MRKGLVGLLISVCFLLSTSAFADDPHAGENPHAGHHLGMDKVGTVFFDVSCTAPARRAFPHAVALLHSFAYEEALAEFTAIATQDPKCAMAYWGQAMTWWRPLWYLPDATALQNGAAAIKKAAALEVPTGRERGYIDALHAFYTDYDKIDHRARAMTYRVAMEGLHRLFPKDNEVAAFYALSLLATASPTDKTFRDQHEAGAILEKVFAEQPDHPGAAHYIIHSFDNPALAKDALLAARSYARIAPSVPHALHMPSHIFTRLGLWNDSIASNLASEKAAKDFQQRNHMASSWDQQLHAMDYLIYAYLQQGHDRQAEGVLKELGEIKAVQPTLVSFYAEAAIPARYAVERGDWKTALSLQPVPSGTPETQAITHWARAMGAVHAGQLDVARAEIKQLEAIRDQLAANKRGYDWSVQVEVQRREAAAWLAHAEKDDGVAVPLMRSAAELEDSTDKHPVTPGPVLPARELLADLLMEAGNPGQAFQEYEADLKVAPHRFRGVRGAARAAEATGKHDDALRYQRELRELMGPEAKVVTAERMMLTLR